MTEAYDDLQSTLERAAERAARARQVVGRRGELEKQVREVGVRVGELRREVVSEESDVEKLERTSFTSFLAGLTGKKDERLARERVEAESARHRLRGQEARLEQLERELARSVREAGELEGSEAAYAQALTVKAEYLQRRGGATAEALAAVDQEIAEVRAEIKEYDEARRAAGEVAPAINRVLHCLGGAESAATWDLAGVGGVFAEAAEHDRLHDADRAAWEAQRLLDRLAVELADIGKRTSLAMPKIDTHQFVEVFFDNIVSDWNRRDRTVATSEQVLQVGRALADLMGELETESGALAARLTELRARRETLIREGR